MYYVYFLRSLKTGKIYVGQTAKHPTIRTEEHNAGLSRWTNQHRPFKLIYFESYQCRDCAEHRESFYKSGQGKYIKKAIVTALESINPKLLTIG